MPCSSRYPCVHLSTLIPLCLATPIALGTAPFRSWGAVPEYVTSDAQPNSVDDSEGLLGDAFTVPDEGRMIGPFREL